MVLLNYEAWWKNSSFSDVLCMTKWMNMNKKYKLIVIVLFIYLFSKTSVGLMILLVSLIATDTLRWAETVVRGVLVIRHRSADPGVGLLAFGSNSFPAWCRLFFCSPKLKALRSPWNTDSLEVIRGNSYTLLPPCGIVRCVVFVWSSTLKVTTSIPKTLE